jgi:hypothetical protein
MRGLSASRASTAVAVVTAIVGVLTMIGFAGLGIGQPTFSHGGPPSEVFMQTQAAPEACAEVSAGSVFAMPQEIELTATSHVLAYFTFEWTGLDRGEFGLLNLVLDDVGAGSNYEFRRARINPNGTVMWSFPNIAPGTHTVSVYAAVDRLGHTESDLVAGLENCALTVFVMPVAS